MSRLDEGHKRYRLGLQMGKNKKLFFGAEKGFQVWMTQWYQVENIPHLCQKYCHDQKDFYWEKWNEGHPISDLSLSKVFTLSRLDKRTRTVCRTSQPFQGETFWCPPSLPDPVSRRPGVSPADCHQFICPSHFVAFQRFWDKMSMSI